MLHLSLPRTHRYYCITYFVTSPWQTQLAAERRGHHDQFKQYDQTSPKSSHDNRHRVTASPRHLSINSSHQNNLTLLSHQRRSEKARAFSQSSRIAFKSLDQGRLRDLQIFLLQLGQGHFFRNGINS